MWEDIIWRSDVDSMVKGLERIARALERIAGRKLNAARIAKALERLAERKGDVLDQAKAGRGR